jgi:hypothetical protein
LGGDGTPLVAAFTPEPFALAVGLSPAAGAQLIGDALDLRHRLPLLWKRVARLEVPAWQARRVARQTHRLSKSAAVWVDEQLADRTSCGPVIVDRLVAQVIAAGDPEQHEDKENDAQAGWDVTLTHPEATDFVGTSHLDATGDTLTLKAFYAQVCDIAHQLLLDGDTSPLGVRKIKALGILTGQPAHSASRRSRRTSASTPATSRPDDPRPPARSRSSAPPPSPRSAPGSATTRSSSNPSSTWPAATPSTPTTHHRGCATSSSSATATASSPDAQVDARSCDLDHTIPYDQNGPPGQTRPTTSPPCAGDTTAPRPPDAGDNLRTPEGRRTSGTAPDGTTYLVTAQGTVTRHRHA